MRSLDKALSVRSGEESLNQEYNIQSLANSKTAGIGNSWLDSNLVPVTVRTVCTIGARTFFKRGRIWIDSRIALKNEHPIPDQQVHFGTKAYFTMVNRLGRENLQGILTLRGDVFVEIDGKIIQICNPQK